MGNQLFSSSQALPQTTPSPITSSSPLVVSKDVSKDEVAATTSCGSADKILKDARKARKNYQKYSAIEEKEGSVIKKSSSSPSKRSSSSPRNNEKIAYTTNNKKSSSSSPKRV